MPNPHNRKFASSLAALSPFYHPKKYGRRKRDHQIRCNACGFSVKSDWKLGDKCPKCDSDKFFPTVHISSTTRKKRIAASVCLILLIVFLFRLTSGQLNPIEGTYRIQLVCNDCHKVFQTRVTVSQIFPMKCPEGHWGRKTVSPAFKCAQGHIFAGSMDSEFYQNFCPLCRSSQITRVPVKD